MTAATGHVDQARAWSAAQGARRAFLHDLLAGARPPKGAAAYLATELAINGPELRQYLTAVDQVTEGHDRQSIIDTARSMTEGRALLAALAIVLAAQEEALTRTNWRTRTDAGTRYLAFLSRCGYQLSDVEHDAGQQPDLAGPAWNGPVTTARTRSTPAELNDELHALLDLELGHPRRRTTASSLHRGDRDAVHAIAEQLRRPAWDTELLEQVCDIIRDTGRQVSGPPLARLAG